MKKSELRSMTGYASIERPFRGGRVRLELKSLNHRFFDLRLRTCKEVAPLEFQIRSFLQNKIQRGSADLRVDFSPSPEHSTPPYALNLEVARSILNSANELRSALKLQDSLSLDRLTQFSDVLTRPDETVVDATSLWQEFEPILSEAHSLLDGMKKREGSALKEALISLTESIQNHLASIEARRPQLKQEQGTKIRERLQKIMDSFPVTFENAQNLLESRIAQEIAMVYDKTDIEEEITRLKGHIGHFLETLNEGGSIGKKCDFLLQEMGREVNTLGNKAQDYQLSESVIPMKVILEQIREQSMNVE